jgi:uncharacterized protein
VSQLADRFVKDAHEVVKAGDVVKVRVVDVDIKRKRIGLTMRKDGGAPAGAPQREAKSARNSVPRNSSRSSATVRGNPSQGAFAAAFADALKRK